MTFKNELFRQNVILNKIVYKKKFAFDDFYIYICNSHKIK